MTASEQQAHDMYADDMIGAEDFAHAHGYRPCESCTTNDRKIIARESRAEEASY